MKKSGVPGGISTGCLEDLEREPGDVDRLLPVGARFAADQVRVEDRRDVADGIAVWIGHPKPRSTDYALCSPQ
jgi:hypothetical protein